LKLSYPLGIGFQIFRLGFSYIWLSSR